jgi:hypothetical protein
MSLTDLGPFSFPALKPNSHKQEMDNKLVKVDQREKWCEDNTLFAPSQPLWRKIRGGITAG